MDWDLGSIMALGTIIGSAGAAWGAARTALNGTKGRVQEIKTELAAHTAADLAVQTQMIDRLARIETKIDYMAEKQKEK